MSSGEDDDNRHHHFDDIFKSTLTNAMGVVAEIFVETSSNP